MLAKNKKVARTTESPQQSSPTYGPGEDVEMVDESAQSGPHSGEISGGTVQIY